MEASYGTQKGALIKDLLHIKNSFGVRTICRNPSFDKLHKTSKMFLLWTKFISTKKIVQNLNSDIFLTFSTSKIFVKFSRSFACEAAMSAACWDTSGVN